MGSADELLKRRLKASRTIALGFLTPFDEKPFKRGQERLEAAVASFAVRSKPKKRV